MTGPADFMTPEYPESIFSYTTKDARGDLFTVRGLDFDEFHGNLSQIVGAERVETILGEIRNRIDTQPNKGAQSSAPASSAPAPAGNTGGGAPAPQAASQGASEGDWKANAPFCAHGQRRATEWKDRKQNTQYTYFCPQPREVPQSEKCSPIDAVSGKEWGAK